MNTSMNLPAMQKIMMEFERQSDTMDMKVVTRYSAIFLPLKNCCFCVHSLMILSTPMQSEMMSDVIDGVMEDPEDEDESEEIVNKVLDELGLSLSEEAINKNHDKKMTPPSFSSTQTSQKSPLSFHTISRWSMPPVDSREPQSRRSLWL